MERREKRARERKIGLGFLPRIAMARERRGGKREKAESSVMWRGYIVNVTTRFYSG